jgi:RimK family alpha-L-glutamate ligase
MMIDHTRVAIVAKGRPSVHETKGLVKALTDRGLSPEICHPDRFSVVAMGSARPILTYEGKPFPLPDLTLSRTGSGTGSHAAAILRHIETLGGDVVNPLSSIQAAMDKGCTMQRVAAAGLPIPLTMIYTAKNAISTEWTGEYPCIVKIATGSRGNGVFKCDYQSQLKAFFGLMKVFDPHRPFLVQEYLADRPGNDVRVLVIGGKAVGAMLRTSKDGDFRANISAGGVGKRLPLTVEMAELGEKVARLLGLEIAGIDLLFRGERFVICEANSSPGFRGFEAYCGLDVAGTIADYVTNRLHSRLTLQNS